MRDARLLLLSKMQRPRYRVLPSQGGDEIYVYVIYHKARAK